MTKSLILLLLTVVSLFCIAKAEARIIVVDQQGKGDFKTITEAINSLPMFNYERTTILVKQGTYNEKIKIDQDFITIMGEGKDSTFIKYSQLRSDWEKNKDNIGPAVLNINGDDFILKDISVENTQSEVGPHAFAVYGKGTRTVFLNCSFKSKGGDTVSLWNYKEGMYYHKGCYFEGAVDFVCPRGWCYITDSEFYEYKQTASVWHAGGYDSSQKLVIKNSSFDGVKGFELGRHHYEAQFYFINCKFSENMADKNIYYVKYDDPSKNRPFNWGERYRFLNCHRIGGDYKWFKDNTVLTDDDITSLWTFDNKWNPESYESPGIKEFLYSDTTLQLTFDETVTVTKEPLMLSSEGDEYAYISGSGSKTLVFIGAPGKKLLHKMDVTNGEMIGNRASAYERRFKFRHLSVY